MGPHVRIPFIDFMSNGGERSKTLNLREEEISVGYTGLG